MRTERFSKPAPEIAQRYSESVSFDWSYIDTILQDRLRTPQRSLRQESQTADERQKIENELRAIEREIGSGKFEWDQSLEDVHMNIEATLTKRIGAVGGSFTLRAAGTTRWRWIFGFV